MEEFAAVGDIQLCYEVLGEEEDPTVLLVMGLGLSMDWWRDGFCRGLVDRGFRVARFDNRDVGPSTHLRGRGIGPWGFLTRRATPVYTLGDMADDAAGLLAYIAPDGAHVVGASLGAMVAQEIAIRHPGRPGDGRTPEDDEDVRVTALRASARETGDGGSRQLAACVGERDRTADLGRLTCPTLVIHGDRDRVIRPDGGRATAAAIPGSELLEVPGMGHDLARSSWPVVLDGIERIATRTRA